MTFEDLLNSKKLSIYQLSVKSNVPKTTLQDIYSGKTDILKCNGKTLLALSTFFEIPIEDILKLEKNKPIREIPLFLKNSISKLKRAIRNNNSLLDCYYDELNSSINVAEVENLITKEEAISLRRKYLHD